MRARLVGLVLIVVAIGAAIAVGVMATGEDSQEPVRVGVVYNISGGMKWLDIPAQEGSLLAAKQINADGGILGRDIEMVPADGTTDVVQMTRVASDLVARDDIIAIAGITEPLHSLAPVRAVIKRATGGLLTFAHSETALAVGEVTHEAGVPFVTSGSTSPDLPGQIGEDVFMVAASHEAGAGAIARFAWNALGARAAWVLVDEEYDYAKTMAGAFQKTWTGLGGESSGDTFARGSTIEISDQIDRLKGLANTPDVIFIASLQNDGGYLVRQLREAGLSQPILFADVVDPRYIVAAAGDMEGVHMSTHGTLIDPDEDIQEFAEAYEAEYGDPPESATAMLGYDSIRLIAEALERSGSVGREALSNSLAATDHFGGLTGVLSYPDGSGVPIKTITIVSYGEDGPEVAATIDPSS